MDINNPAFNWQGKTIRDEDGEKIGKVDEVYIDNTTEAPEWVETKTSMFGSGLFIPVVGASERDDDLIVAFKKDFLKDAPRQKADGLLSPEEERELYAYYQQDYQESDSGAHELSTHEARRAGKLTRWNSGEER